MDGDAELTEGGEEFEFLDASGGGVHALVDGGKDEIVLLCVGVPLADLGCVVVGETEL